MDTDGYFVIMQADRFEGPYALVRSFKPEGFGVGDFDMYVDEVSGKAYVWFERPHWEMVCAELTDDFLGTNGNYSALCGFAATLYARGPGPFRAQRTPLYVHKRHHRLCAQPVEGVRVRLIPWRIHRLGLPPRWR